MTEAELIHQGWALWDIQTEMSSVWHVARLGFDAWVAQYHTDPWML